MDFFNDRRACRPTENAALPWPNEPGAVSCAAETCACVTAKKRIVKSFINLKTWLRFSCLLGLLLAGQSSHARPAAIWIDTDLSIGSPIREVDDAYALLVAANSPRLRIVGVSATYGNAPLPAVTRRTADLFARLGRPRPIHPGASAASDLGRSTEATESLVRALARENRLTYLALGPLTNLATFLRLHPDRAHQFEQIIAVGGMSPGVTLGFGPGEKFRIHDANVFKDPAAFRVVLESRVPLLLAPCETSSRLLIQREDLDRLAAGPPAAQFVARKSRFWLWFWERIPRARGGPIFDALAAVAAARPSLLQIEKRRAHFDSASNLIVERSPAGAKGREVSFVAGFAPETKEFILERMNRRR